MDDNNSLCPCYFSTQQHLACHLNVFYGSTRLLHATPSHDCIIILWTTCTMLPITHKPLGAWLAALRLLDLTLASTDAVISLSISGTREQEKETRTRGQLKVRGKGKRGKTLLKKKRARSIVGDLNLILIGRNCTVNQSWDLPREGQWLDFFPEQL